MNTLNLSDPVLSLLFNSCAGSTWKQYESVLKKWSSFCVQYKYNELTPTLSAVLSFLTKLFDSGLSYTSVNTARSALSTLFAPLDGIKIGEHPLVIRLLKGVARSRPPKPRYDTIWDANCVLNVFLGWAENELLSLKDLTIKLLGLMALISAQRVQTFAVIQINEIHFSNIVEIFVPSVLKTYNPNKLRPCLVFPPYPNESKLCIVKVLTEYLSRTLPYRRSNTLFISYCAPHGEVGTQTLSRWLRELLKLANIDVSKFKGHSFRHAATSKAAKLGVGIDSIFSCAGWTSGSSTFAKFYNKKIDKRCAFSNSVLSL